MRMRTHRRRAGFIGVVAVAAGALLAGGTAAPALALEELDGDALPALDLETGQPLPDAPSSLAATLGYTTYAGIRANIHDYTVRFVASSRAELYRSPMKAVADELRGLGLVNLTIAPGQFADKPPADHEIYVHTDPQVPCRTGSAACGQPLVGQRATQGTVLARAGHVWVVPLTDRYAEIDRRHVIAHELGHVLGLDHYSSLFGGAYQVMHPSDYSAKAYQKGDIAGMTHLMGEAPRGSFDSATVPSAGTLRVVGWGVDPDQSAAATIRVTIDGVTAAERTTTVHRPDVDTALSLIPGAPRGFDVTVNLPAGAHVVCLTAKNYPLTTWQAIGQCKTVTPAGAVTVDRVQGADRYASAAAVSRAAFPSTAPVVVVANGDAFPDALAAGPVASKLGGPLLLTQAGALPAATASEIARLKPQRIVVAGGAVSVSDAVYAALARLTTTMARVGGADRYDTSRRLATYAFGSAGSAYVASGDSFPDALGAGAAAARAKGPLLLVNTAANAGIDTPTASLLTKLKATRVRVAGGTAAVADGTVSKVKAAVADTKRVYGADRFETAIALSKDGFTASTRAFIVNGMNFPDGIVSPPLAARTGSPVFLSPGTCVPKGVLAELGRLSARTFTLVGGTTSLTADVAAMRLCA